MHAHLLRSAVWGGSIGPEAESDITGPWLCSTLGPREAALNKALVCEPLPNPAADLQRPAAWFRQRNTPFSFVLREDADALAIATLQSQGRTAAKRSPAMHLPAIPTSLPTVPGLEIAHAATPSGFADFANVGGPATTAFIHDLYEARTLFSDILLLVGYVDGYPAATSAAVLSGDHAGIYNVLVEEAFRGRGIGAAITLAAAAAGAAEGCTAASLVSTPLAVPLYQRLGFVTRFHYLEFPA